MEICSLLLKPNFRILSIANLETNSTNLEFSTDTAFFTVRMESRLRASFVDVRNESGSQFFPNVFHFKYSENKLFLCNPFETECSSKDGFIQASGFYFEDSLYLIDKNRVLIIDNATSVHGSVRYEETTLYSLFACVDLSLQFLLRILFLVTGILAGGIFIVFYLAFINPLLRSRSKVNQSCSACKQARSAASHPKSKQAISIDERKRKKGIDFQKIFVAKSVKNSSKPSYKLQAAKSSPFSCKPSLVSTSDESKEQSEQISPRLPEKIKVS